MEETEYLEQPEEQAAELPEQVQTEEVREQEDPFLQHILGLEAQAQAMQAEIPDFQLAEALQDPVFLQLTAPGTGISVADAYYALHRQEIQNAAARQAREKVVSAIQAGARRPLESGTSSQSPSLLSFHYESATREQRDAFKKELRRAWGRGETVYPR